MIIFDILGWIGMIMVVVPYILLSLNKISNGYLYQYLNFSASVLMAIGLFPKNAWFSFALQVIWGSIAFIALINISKSKKGQKNGNS